MSPIPPAGLAPPAPGDHAAGDAALADALSEAADALARRVSDRTPAAQAHGRAEIAALPAPLARVLLARLDARVDREAPPPTSEWLDPDRARDAAQAWHDAARDAARVPAPDWAAFLADGCRLALAHAVRPAETLAAVAFEDDGPAERPAARVLGRLGAFEPYPYLPEIARGYAERKGVDRLDRAGLESLLRRIDRRMVEALSADEWAGLLAPLVALAGPDGVPELLLVALFRAKGRDDLARAVAGAGPLSADALRARLDAALGPPSESGERATAPPRGAGDAGGAVASPPGDPAPRAAVEGRADGTAGHAAPPPEPSDVPGDLPGLTEHPTPAARAPAAVPLWMQAMAPAARPDVSADAPGHAPTDTADAEPLWKRFMPRPVAAPDAHLPRPPVAPPRPPLPDAPAGLAPAAPPEALLSGLDRLERAALGRPADAARRDAYVADLFGGSEADYGATLAALARDTTWTDATATIARDVFRRHRVSPLSDAAIAFMDDVQSRFR